MAKAVLHENMNFQGPAHSLMLCSMVFSATFKNLDMLVCFNTV